MQGEHSILSAKFRQEMYFADFLGREKHLFLKQPNKWTVPAQI